MFSIFATNSETSKTPLRNIKKTIPSVSDYFLIRDKVITCRKLFTTQ